MGHEVTIKSSDQAIRLGLAYLPEDRQIHGLIPPMNIVENISLPMLKEYAHWGWLDSKAERSASLGAARQMEVRANHIFQKAPASFRAAINKK